MICAALLFFIFFIFRYCLDLELLNVQFRNQVVKSQLLSPRQVSELFGNLDLIQEFHKNFLAELEKRMAIWYVQCLRHKLKYLPTLYIIYGFSIY